MPFGYDVSNEQTADGNILGHRAFQVFDCSDSVGAPCLLETPNSSMLKNLPSWKNLERRASVEATRVDSCAFGSRRLKAFKFLRTHLKLVHSRRRCRCTTKHLKVEGSLTKASATYVPELARALAMDFKAAILEAQHRRSSDLDVAGLENMAVNHLALSLDWEEVSAWKFKRPMHINLLETKSVERLIEDEVSALRGDQRMISLIDSNVARCALSKGRSSSFALSSVLRRIDSLMVAGGIYLCTPYCPTRLNISDDPTRGRTLRSHVGDFGSWTREEFMNLALIRPLRRWSANWLRLTLCLLHFSVVPIAAELPHRRTRTFLDFDRTLGFPGEGPQACGLFPIMFLALAIPSLGFLSVLLGLLILIRQPVTSFPPLVLLVVCLSCPAVHAMDSGPRNHGDLLRRTHRETLGPLPQGRLVLEVTAAQRDRLLAYFLTWCDGEGLDMRVWIKDARNFLEEINLCLCKFGRTMYDWGRPLNHFVETINALTSYKPELRRQVQAPWDIAFNWSRLEPNVHHVAAPFQIIMALLSVSLMWVWLPMAGAIAMMWGALLRPGELTSAIRKQLTLPSDLENTISFGILAITEPKTRFSAARHQAARLDIPDLLEVAEMAFSSMDLSQRIWPFSGQTLRLRFKDLLRAVGLPTEKKDGLKPLDLGSLRAGGATWTLQVTESGELCRRRGRWVSQKVMDLYIQEVPSLQYFNHVRPAVKSNVLTFARAFPSILEKAKLLHHCKIDPRTWYIIFKSTR